MELELAGTVALVTGSSRGIGRAVAAAFMREGAAVVVTGRDAEDLDEARADLSAQAGDDRVLAWRGDLTDAAQIDDCVTATLERFGRLDAVVAAVGGGAGTRGWDVDPDETEAILTANLFAGLQVARATAPHLLEQEGASLTFVASIAGLESLDAPIAYGAAKAGLIAAAKGLARTLAPRVRVNVVAPGNVLAPGGTWERKLRDDGAAVTTLLERDVPLRRLGTPEEIADAVVFLASKRASFVTGACLVVDGGQTRGI